MRARGVRVLNIAVKNPSRVKEELAAQVRDAVLAMRKNDVDLSNSLFWITGSTNLFEIIDLGHQPLCDSLLTKEQLSQPETTYPLKLMMCPESGLAQLSYDRRRDTSDPDAEDAKPDPSGYEGDRGEVEAQREQEGDADDDDDSDGEPAQSRNGSAPHRERTTN